VVGGSAGEHGRSARLEVPLSKVMLVPTGPSSVPLMKRVRSGARWAAMLARVAVTGPVNVRNSPELDANE